MFGLRNGFLGAAISKKTEGENLRAKSVRFYRKIHCFKTLLSHIHSGKSQGDLETMSTSHHGTIHHPLRGISQKGFCRHNFMKVCAGWVRVGHGQGQGVLPGSIEEKHRQRQSDEAMSLHRFHFIAFIVTEALSR